MISTREEARALRALRVAEPYTMTCGVCGAEITAYYANKEAICDRCYHARYRREWRAKRKAQQAPTIIMTTIVSHTKRPDLVIGDD